MKGKTALTLMEQAIMLLILSLAAALCLQAFVWADHQSRSNSDRDKALTELQSAAEILKSQNGNYLAAAAIYGGQADVGQWVICWDEQWEQTSYPGTYQLYATEQNSSVAGLGCSELTLRNAEEVLGNLQLCWQEVAP